MTGLFTPRAVRLVEAYADGTDARHLTFEPLDASDASQATEGAAPTPGQFFLLTVPGHGEAAFTYVRLPDTRGRFDAVVRRVGELTRALHDVPVGTVLGCRGPFGRGWPLDPLAGKRVAVLAGGCGLAPLACAIDALLHAGSDVVVAYGSRDEASQVLARERERWRGRVPVVESFDAPTRPENLRGTPVDHLDRACARWNAPPECALVCGPEVMMDAAATALVRRGVAPAHIWLSLERRMHCGVGLCGHCYVAQTYACVDGPTYRWDELCALRAKSPLRARTLTELHHC